jgi:hypothetical protein
MRGNFGMLDPYMLQLSWNGEQTLFPLYSDTDGNACLQPSLLPTKYFHI